VVLEVTAKTDNAAVLPIGRKDYYEIGYDLDQKQRMGSWQIREIADLALQPNERTEETFVKELPEGTRSAEIEIKVSVWPDPKTELVVHRVVKKISFEGQP
jgi:hypothetical protein